jgi:NADH-quinone oxidoreductase subunit C
MSLIEQLAAELSPLAVAAFTPLPPLPKPAPAKPAAAAAPGAAPTTPAAPAVPDPAATAGSPSVAASAAKEGVQVLDFASKGVHLDVCITPDKVVEAAQILDRHGFAIDAVSGQDWLAQGLMEVIYDFLHFQSGERVVYRARIPRAEPRIATISEIFPGANWHERETHDMFGIVFVGHPNLTPFLLPDDADFHPLRKDYNP